MIKLGAFGWKETIFISKGEICKVIDILSKEIFMVYNFNYKLGNMFKNYESNFILSKEIFEVKWRWKWNMSRRFYSTSLQVLLFFFSIVKTIIPLSMSG